MTIEETAILFGLWMSENQCDECPVFPETILLGGMIGLCDKILDGMKEHPELKWRHWEFLSQKWKKFPENPG